MKCVVSGSFRKFYDGITKTVEEFERCGVKVLSPKVSRIINGGGEFAILESDTTKDIRLLEKNHLAAIKEADFLYVYNPEGYIGTSATMEIGWALALNKPVFSLQKPSDLVLAEFIKVKSPKDVAAEMDLA